MASESREVANALALKQTAVSRSESAAMALQQQLLTAEAELLRAKEAHWGSEKAGQAEEDDEACRSWAPLNHFVV